MTAKGYDRTLPESGSFKFHIVRALHDVQIAF